VAIFPPTFHAQRRVVPTSVLDVRSQPKRKQLAGFLKNNNSGSQKCFFFLFFFFSLGGSKNGTVPLTLWELVHRWLGTTPKAAY